MWRPWVILAVAIVAETIATSSLNASDGFRKFLPSAGAVVGYIVSFYLLSVALREIPLGIAYAVWSGFGVVALTAIGMVVFHQKLTIVQGAGIGLILIGTLIAYMSSSTLEEH